MAKERKSNKKSSKSDIAFYILTLEGLTDFDRQLIPPSFMKYVTEDLGESATLSLPLGRRRWDIQLQKTEEGVYFRNGWKKFLEDNSLGNDEFLVFKYRGNMCFEVEICEKSGQERDYEFTFMNGGQSFEENREKTSFPTEKKERGRPKKIEKNPPKKSEKNPPKKTMTNPRKKTKNNPPSETENDPHMEIKNNPPLVGEKRKRGRPRKIVGSTSGIQHKLQPSETDLDMVERPDLALVLWKPLILNDFNTI